MEAILKAIRDWFLGKEEHFTAFAEADTRLEGWLKAELIVLLNRLSTQRLVDEFEREANVTTSAGRRQIDFRLRLGGVTHLCELKALCVSQAAGTPRNLQFYFREDQVGLIKDFRKLDTVPGSNKWVLGFIYPGPGLRQWRETIASLPEGLRHWRCITSPEDFPDYLFISVWRSEKRSFG